MIIAFVNGSAYPYPPDPMSKTKNEHPVVQAGWGGHCMSVLLQALCVRMAVLSWLVRLAAHCMSY